MTQFVLLWCFVPASEICCSSLSQLLAYFLYSVYLSISSLLSGVTRLTMASQVLEYLSKKGYVRTEAMLRRESEPDRPVAAREPEAGGPKYNRAFGMFFRRDPSQA